MALIEIDYQDTIKKADQIEDLARKLREIPSRDIQMAQSSVSKNWSGSASELYQKRLQTFSRQMDSQARELQSLARSLRAAAARYRRLEQIANGIFGG